MARILEEGMGNEPVSYKSLEKLYKVFENCWYIQSALIFPKKSSWYFENLLVANE